MDIVGREKEIRIFTGILSSKQAEFVAIYGRRRVGKTYLIHEFFSTQNVIYLECTGLKDGSLAEQLAIFMEAFSQTFYPSMPAEAMFIPPKNWQEAFMKLTTEIKKLPANKTIVVFLDELPWLASVKSGLLQNLDHFWNTKWSRTPNFKLVVCGSAASWMMNNLINAKGGLHNRTTKTILLEPFNLAETKLYVQQKKVKAADADILNLYMVMGGIPYYLNHLDKTKSVAENINTLCFKSDGLLYNEFSRLFRSLFDSAELSMKIIQLIATKTYGISLLELTSQTEKTAGGRFQERLNELESAGFIQKFLPYGRTKRDHYYRLTDPYCLFYLTWIESFVTSNTIPRGVDYWSRLAKSAKWNSWVGYAFENICHLHIDKIIAALGLSGIGCIVNRWRFIPPKGSTILGAEIDLLIDRDDEAITICEIKYCSSPFVIDKSYAKVLANKLEVFAEHFKLKKQLFLVMVTSNGFKPNLWSEDLVAASVELKDLF